MTSAPTAALDEPSRLEALLAKVHLLVFDFDGVFTDNTVYVDQEGVESVRCWRSDGIGLSRVKSMGVSTLILSTEVNPVVTVRARKLQVPCVQGVADKAATLISHCAETRIELASALFLGNDINDIAALRVVGIPMAVGDAYPEILGHVVYRTRRKGGKGAVREVCDLVFNAKRRSLQNAVGLST